MDEPRSIPKGPIVAAAAFTLLVAYVSAFYLAGITNKSSGGARCHFYRWHWQVVLFTPAAKVESVIIGRTVYVLSTED